MSDKCKELAGSHGCVYSIYLPWICKFPDEPDEARQPKIVDIDKCLISEVLGLWKLGIKTTGNCCGHGTEHPFISVREEYVLDMEKLGYEQMTNLFCLEDKTMFYAKTKVVLSPEQYAKFDFPMKKKASDE